MRGAVITLLLALPCGVSAQTPLRHDVSNPYLAPLPVCQDSLPPAGDTLGFGPGAPQVRALVVPPMPVPKAILGTTAEVRILVNVQGEIDSIVIRGLTDSAYARKLREGIFAQGRYLPAHTNGCRRAGWTMHQMTFNR